MAGKDHSFPAFTFFKGSDRGSDKGSDRDNVSRVSGLLLA
jgi:hypothetical protein